MGSLKPYLIRAVYEWIVENELTPYLLVDAEGEKVDVPQAYVREGRIVLDVRPTAIRQLSLGNEWIEFDARFGGVPRQVGLPVAKVLAIYAKETGKGLVFEKEDSNAHSSGPESKGKSTRPILKAVK